MAVTALNESWLGYDADTGALVFWDGATYRPLEEAAGYAAAVHMHAVGDVTGLQGELDGKAAAGHSHAIGDVTGLQTALDARVPLMFGGGRLKYQQSFIAGGTWTRGTGERYVLVWCIGGGGGGGGAAGGASGAASGAGGGAGGLSVKWIDVSAITSVSVTVGTGGTAGDNTGGSGGTGGTSSFGSHCSADGGTGGAGQGNDTFQQIVAGGYGGNAADGDFNFTGGAGAPGFRLDALNGIAGRGAAAAFFGGGGNGYAGNSAGQQGIARGDGGGGGVVASNATGRAGGVGSTGLVWLWVYE